MDIRGRATLIGRYSKYSGLMTPGRNSYPLDQGALGRAYQQSPGIMMDLPDPAQDFETWVGALLSAGIPETTCRNLTMRARNCFAYQVCAADGDAHPIGILVIESQLTTQQARGTAPTPRLVLDPDEIGKRIKRAEARLRATLEVAREIVPLD